MKKLLDIFKVSNLLVDMFIKLNEIGNIKMLPPVRIELGTSAILV